MAVVLLRLSPEVGIFFERQGPGTRDHGPGTKLLILEQDLRTMYKAMCRVRCLMDLVVFA